MSFGFHPLHIVTRGRLDGQYGIATRGYLICPDIVPRFPADADLFVELDLKGVVEPERLYAQFTDHDSYASLKTIEMEAQLRMIEGMLASAKNWDMVASVELVEVTLGSVTSSEVDPELVVVGDIGAVTGEDAESAVEIHDPLGEVDGEEPPH